MNRGHYDQTIFHQVLKDHAILGGGYTTAMKEKPAQRTVHNESNNGLKNVRGTIGMVRRPDVINSATCQFYISSTRRAIVAAAADRRNAMHPA